MTNSLPAGTRNTSLNLIDEEHELVTATTGQAGTFYKDWALVGLEYAAKSGDEAAAWLAAGIKSIRAERLRMKHGIVTLICLLTIGGELSSRFDSQPDDPKRRSVRRVLTLKVRTGRKRFSWGEEMV